MKESNVDKKIKFAFNVTAFVLVVFIILGIAACVDNNAKITSSNKVSDKEYLNIKDSNGYVDLQLIIDKFEYEGHEYIWFKRGQGNKVSGGPVHNPDCKYCKENGTTYK